MRASQHESLAYIQSMTRELVDIAKGARLDMLAYLLEMAYFEASDQMREQWQEKNLPADPLAPIPHFGAGPPDAHRSESQLANWLCTSEPVLNLPDASAVQRAWLARKMPR